MYVLGLRSEAEGKNIWMITEAEEGLTPTGRGWLLNFFFWDALGSSDHSNKQLS